MYGGWWQSRKVFTPARRNYVTKDPEVRERETALENSMHLVMQRFTVLQEAERFFHDKEFRLYRTQLMERNKHTEDFGQQKNLLMHAGALFMGLIATHCPSITKESISSLQKNLRQCLSMAFNILLTVTSLSSPRGCCKESFLLLFKQK